VIEFELEMSVLEEHSITHTHTLYSDHTRCVHRVATYRIYQSTETRRHFAMTRCLDAEDFSNCLVL